MRPIVVNKLFVIIPVFNEESVISDVILGIKKEGYKNIIVVDDGSTDATFLKAKKHSVVILRHMINRGKGAAIKTGIEAAKLLHADCIVTFDGDGQHNPQDIKKIQTALNKFDVVLGTRTFTHIPKIKQVANSLANITTLLIYGMWVNDSQSGLRGFSKKALLAIDTFHDRYEYDSEVIREIGKNNLTYKEVPITVNYTTYSQKKMHKQNLYNGFKTVFKMIISA